MSAFRTSDLETAFTTSRSLSVSLSLFLSLSRSLSLSASLTLLFLQWFHYLLLQTGILHKTRKRISGICFHKLLTLVFKGKAFCAISIWNNPGVILWLGSYDLPHQREKYSDWPGFSHMPRDRSFATRRRYDGSWPVIRLVYSAAKNSS